MSKFKYIFFSVFLSLITTASVEAFPIYAQQGYENPREATGRIVCANCHLAQQPVDIKVPQAVLPNSVFEAVVKIPYDQQIKQVIAKGEKGALNVGAVLILPEGFKIAPKELLSEEVKQHVGKLSFLPYSDTLQNIAVIGPVPGKKYSEMTFPILSPKTGPFLKYPIYLGGNRGRGQIYPNGSKSNNTIYNASLTGTITKISKNEDTIDIEITGADGQQSIDKILIGPDILVKEGDFVTVDQALTNNPNVGGFGQAETEIVLQSPIRVQGLIVFFGFVLFAQVFLVLKKKQYEKVQLSEMNF